MPKFCKKIYENVHEMDPIKVELDYVPISGGDGHAIEVQVSGYGPLHERYDYEVAYTQLMLNPRGNWNLKKDTIISVSYWYD